MLIKRKSVITGNLNVKDIPVNPEDMANWELGFLSIDDAMPYLTDSDREFILSGITKDEWDKAFSQETEEV